MAEDTKVETEVTADDLVDTTEQAAPSETVQAEPGEQEVHAEKPFDKVRQQVQQEIGNKVRPLEAKIDALLAKIEAQGEATPAQKREVEQLAAARDELEDLANTDATDADPYKAVSRLAQRLLKVEAERKAEREVFERRFQQADQATAQSRRLAFEHNWKSEFARVNPDLRDKAEDAYREYVETWGKWVSPTSNVDPETSRRIATNIYESVLSKFKEAAPAAESQATTKTPEKSTRGTQIATTSSSARRTVPSKTELTDDQLIEGFFNDTNG